MPRKRIPTAPTHSPRTAPTTASIIVSAMTPLTMWRWPAPSVRRMASSFARLVARIDAPGFALTERKRPEVWRWALIDKGGLVLEEGFEPNQNDAKRSAADALNVVTIEVF